MSPCGRRIDRRFGLPHHDAGAGFQRAKTDWKIAFDCLVGLIRMSHSLEQKQHNIGVSKNSGTPKWMVKIMENPIKMDDLGGPPLFLETPILVANGASAGRFFFCSQLFSFLKSRRR